MLRRHLRTLLWLVFLAFPAGNTATGQILYLTTKYGPTYRIDIVARTYTPLLKATNGDPAGIVVDPLSERIYWTNGTRGSPFVQRCNMDGSNVEDVVKGPPFLNYPSQLALDANRGHLYFTEIFGGRIWRCNLDGSDLIEVVGSIPNVCGIALDAMGGKLYWTYQNSDRVDRANLDGSEIEPVFSGDYSFGGPAIALDLVAGKVYWGPAHPDYANWGRLLRANLDGSDRQEIQPFNVASSAALAVDGVAGKLFLSDKNSKTLKVCDLDAANCSILVSGWQSAAKSISLDVVNDQLYWIGSDNTWVVEQFMRVNIDGSDPTSILITHTATDGLDIDPVEGVLFWANDYVYYPSVRKATRRGAYGALVMMTGSPCMDVAVDPTTKTLFSSAGDLSSPVPQVKRSAYDGTDPQSLPLADLARPQGLLVEPGAGDLYLADVWAWEVRRSSLDGSGSATLVESDDARHAIDVCIDPFHGKLYWLASEFNGFYERGIVQWSDLDGSNVETLYQADWDVHLDGLALDIQRSNLYFSNPKTRKVYRSNLDGTGREDLVEFPEGDGVTLRRLAFDPFVIGDCDQDQIVDRGDWAGVFSCLSGPQKTAAPSCDCADSAFDGRIDLGDVAEWARRLSAP